MLNITVLQILPPTDFRTVCVISLTMACVKMQSSRVFIQGGHSPGNQGKVRESEKGLKGQGKIKEFKEKKKVGEFKQVV